MRHAGAGEHAPIRLVNRALIANDERDQDPRLRFTLQRNRHARAQAFASRLNEIAWRAHKFVQALVRDGAFS